MSQLTDKTQIRRMKILLMITYMVSYLTRINYGAVIVEISSDTNIAASLLSLAVTGSFFTYGIGQLVSGWIGDKMQPKKIVFCGLTVTVCMNLLITVCQSPWQLAFVWCFNGFAQSFMWPPIVKLMTALFSETEYKKASVTVAWGSSFGTIFVYLAAPVCISIAGWRSLFWLCASMGILMIFIWQKCCPGIAFEKRSNNKKGNDDAVRALMNPMCIGIMIAIMLQGSLRDGVTTWMPSYIKETFDFGSKVSILTGVLLPVFSIVCFQITSWIYKKKPTDPITCAGLIFAAGTASGFLLLQVTGKNAVISIAAMALLTGCMHGVNLLLVTMVPAYFKKNGNVSFVSGLLNFCTYVGSAASTYGIARISETTGWKATILVWLVIAALGTAICFMCIPAWNRFVQRMRE